MTDLVTKLLTNVAAQAVAPVMAVVEFIANGDVSDETSDALIKGFVDIDVLDED